MIIFKRKLFDEASDEGDSGAGDNSGGTDDKKLSLTQDELNKMMADNRKNLTKQNEKLLNELNQLKETSQLTNKEKEELQIRIDEIEQEFLSKEELAKRELNKKEKEYQKQLTSAQEESTFWKNQYSQATIARSIQDAAIQNKAVSPEQIVGLLASNTQIKETEEGSKNFQPVVNFKDIGEDGKPITLELSPMEAVKRMVELTDKFGNLFQGTAAGGLGGSSGSGSGKAPSLTSLKDTTNYMKWRKENPHADPMEFTKNG